MKFNSTLLLLIFILSTLVTQQYASLPADSKGDGLHTQNQPELKTNVTDIGVKDTAVAVDPVNKGFNDTSDLKETNPNDKLMSSKNGTEKVKSNNGTEKVKDDKKEEISKKSKVDTVEEASVRGKCDSSSNRCTDDENTLVACLRVPGDDAPNLSLLIQNRGKGSLTVTISAPDLVQFEKKLVELQQNEDTEVKVSVKGVENDHFIILSAGHGNCRLDFKDQFTARKQVGYTSKSTYLSFSNQKSSNHFFFLAALLIVAVLVLIFLKLWKKLTRKATTKYQMLDTELPVSRSTKVETSVNESWDDSWGDSWDDEEAPKTPSLPVTPSLSSKGMASRKLNKEHWKD